MAQELFDISVSDLLHLDLLGESKGASVTLMLGEAEDDIVNLSCRHFRKFLLPQYGEDSKILGR